MKSMYYDIDGNPIEDVLTWGRMFERMSANGGRHIGDDTINGIRVSTVYLGLDHRFGEGPPLIFETMLFGADPELDQWQERYSTKEEALRGHLAAVAAVKAWFGQRALEEK